MLELAREADWEAVRRLSVQIHELHAAWRPDLYLSSPEPYPREKFREDIQNRMIYVAKLHGVTVGYVVLCVLQKAGPGRISHREMRLETICVEETARRQGIGTAIVEETRALARAFGCRELILGVHPENGAAMDFYRKCGFQVRTANLEMKV